MRKMVLFTFVLAVALCAFGYPTGAQDAQPTQSTKEAKKQEDKIMKEAKKADEKAAKETKKQEKQAMKDAKKQEKQTAKDAKMEAKTDTKMTADGHQMSVALTGAAEVPGPGDTDGNGTAALTLNHDKGEVCYDITVSNIATPTAAHIHAGAAGASGPPKVTLKANAEGMWKGCATADKAVIKEIMDNPANFYVNVHNSEFPGGAVRGQLGK